MADHARRAVVVVLVALALLVAPQVAHAAFTGRAAPALSVGTATLTSPEAVAVSHQCLRPRGLSVSVTGFDFEGPGNVVFRYSIYRGPSNTPSATTTSSSRSVDLAARSQPNGPDTWRLAISAELGNWTGPEWTRTYAC